MNIAHKNAETIADRRADIRSFSVTALFIIFSWVVLSHTSYLKIAGSNASVSWMDPWLTQFTSHLGILLAIPVIPFLLSRAPLSLGQWYRQIPLYIIGFFVFGAIHILLMDIYRTLSFPPLLGRPYSDDLLNKALWFYELPKDAYSFLLILSVFMTGRHIEQLRLEAENVKTEAKTSGRLMLKSGGRILFLQAEDIIHAQAASNYLEIETTTGQHLVRLTLTALETLISETGHSHIRVHRSHLVKQNALRQIIPQSDGRLRVELTTGKTIPVGRKYKDRLSQLTHSSDGHTSSHS